MQMFIHFLLLFGSLGLADPAEKTFILVELFTSEGCSSCPPADRLLSEIVDQDHAGVEVIGLSFHVDYWDYIGWKDPYADQKYTQRQRAYARKFYSNQVYTPQMVVNGKHEFVGSSKSKWENIFRWLSFKESSYSIELKKVNIIKNQLTVRVSSESQDKVVLNVALVERRLSQDVTRGENRGKKLSHDNVVRSFETRHFDGQLNEISLDIPSDMNRSKSSLILYVQNVKNWEVLGALKVPVVD